MSRWSRFTAEELAGIKSWLQKVHTDAAEDLLLAEIEVDDRPLESPSALAAMLLGKERTWTPPPPSQEESRSVFQLRTDWRLLRCLVKSDEPAEAGWLAAATNLRIGVVRGRLRSLGNRGLVLRLEDGGYVLTERSSARIRRGG